VGGYQSTSVWGLCGGCGMSRAWQWVMHRCLATIQLLELVESVARARNPGM
jgi:hypothetical protein